MTKNQTARPKRRATKAHFIRYLQTRNPSRLEEEDLRRALEASLEDCPVDYWQEDSAQRSPSDQSNGASSSAGSSTGGVEHTTSTAATTPIGHSNTCNGLKSCKYNRRNRRGSSCCSRFSQHQCSSSMQNTIHCGHNCQINHNSIHASYHHHHNHSHPATNCIHHANSCCHTASQQAHQCCPYASVHRRYKPVAKKNIYDEADFFHDGIMAYIEYELLKRTKQI